MNRLSKFLSIIIRILVITAIIGVIALVYSTCAGGDVVKKIDKTLPEYTAAPFEITTITKIYFAKNAIKNDNGSVTMFDWYEKDDGKWNYHKGELPLLPVLHPVISKRQ